MDALFNLSGNKCVLLAVYLASEANLAGLKALCAARRDALDKEILLRVLLTYLPETTEPSTYTALAQDIADDKIVYAGDDAPDISPVNQLFETQAKKRVQKLETEMLPLKPATSRIGDDVGLFEQFLVHRAYRIDEDAQLDLIPQLVDPYLEESAFLRTWFISSVLPLLRYGYEYYTDNDTLIPLERFDRYTGGQGVELLLSKSAEPIATKRGITYNGARDMRGLVGPWMYGSHERKRRKLNGATGTRETNHDTIAARDVQLIRENSQDSEDLNTDHEWEHTFDWLAKKAAHDFPLVVDTIEKWGGPTDVDMGGYEQPGEQAANEERTRKLHLQYVQSAYAAVYSVDSYTPETIEGTHSMLVRLAELMEFVPPPDLATSVEMLPKIDDQANVLTETSSAALLPNALLQSGHPLTTPELETYALLQLFVFTAYMLAGLGQPISVHDIAEHRFQATADEQFSLLQQILLHAAQRERKDEEQWDELRRRLVWLWTWGIEAGSRDAQFGAGVLGKIDRSIFAREVMQALLTAGCYDLVKRSWLDDEPLDGTRLLQDEIESNIINTAMQFYDNASNGNRTRGGMKRASDIVANFRYSFPDSPSFRRCEALLAATHSLSFYSLTLQHGVPFQPVNIRVSKDPVSLLNKVLEQNPRSYTKLDDLISIGTNLVSAGLPDQIAAASDGMPAIEPTTREIEAAKVKAERRVIGMAIEQALHEDDFETAYSYVTTRLNPPAAAPPVTDGKDAATEAEDDLSWRAAFIAGRHRSANDSSATAYASGSAQLRKPGVRRLEQRMELLSQALLLAPQQHLPEVLAQWRRCEEEMDALVKQEAAEDEEFNDRADQRIPGGFGPSMSPPVQTRREVGRGAVEEAPMGLFDVMGGAAKALSRTMHGPRTGARPAPTQAQASPRQSMDASMSSLGSGDEGSGADRVRKRDMVANAASGALASGLGWMLGATPVSQRPPSR